MKLNKSKLRQLAQSGEVAAAPVSLKRKRVDEGSSKRAEEAPSRPPVQDAVPLVRDVPPVIMVDVDPAPSSRSFCGHHQPEPSRGDGQSQGRFHL
jgi:hypothetical protein